MDAARIYFLNNMAESKNLEIGKSYDREDISQMFGGNYQHALPHANGDVVCGCFDPVLNPNAPKEVLVGFGRDRERFAARIVEQNVSIPIFIKRAAKQYEFVGHFHATGFSKEANEVSQKTKLVKNPDKIPGVLYFEEAKTV